MEFTKSDEYKRIFASASRGSLQLKSRESRWLEFKESFNWGSRNEYAKSIAAFANTNGGFIVFGIKNQPRMLVGLQNDNFGKMDEAKITEYLNSAFSPEIGFEKFTETVRGKKIGFIRVYQSPNKPIVSTKNDGDIKEAEIYYRYTARTEKIKYAELNILLKKIQEKNEENWMNLFKKISKIGPENAAILNVPEGRIDGQKGTLMIDRKLIPKLKFIKEGNFKERGWPTLKLIGDVKAISMRGNATTIRLTNDPSAPVMRVEEESIIKKDYPLDYRKLIVKMKERYSNFSPSQRFHNIKKELIKNPELSKTRYLDPINQTGSRKTYYSPSILKEFDKHYTKK